MKELNEKDKISGKIEIIKKALGIESIEEMNQLIVKLDEKQKALKLKKFMDETGELNLDSDDIIDIRNEVIEILTEFMRTKSERKKALGVLFFKVFS